MITYNDIYEAAERHPLVSIEIFPLEISGASKIFWEIFSAFKLPRNIEGLFPGSAIEKLLFGFSNLSLSNNLVASEEIAKQLQYGYLK